MKYNIIENCSPYYIKFSFPEINSVICAAQNVIPNFEKSFISKHFQQQYYHEADAVKIIKMLPFHNKFKWNISRVSPFITVGTASSRIHKDGWNTRVSFNLPLFIFDSNCLTTWYSDEELADCTLDSGGVYNDNRVPNNSEFKRRNPIKSMTHNPGEMVLFNTDIFHKWDNSKSNNIRSILTLRLDSEYEGEMHFDKVKDILFD